MSTDLVNTINAVNRQQFQPIEQWFWPTNTLLSPSIDSTNKVESVKTSSVATSMSSTSATYHRRHRHWWKVCWIYNNGNFVCQRVANQSKQSDFKQFHQQLQQSHSLSMCSTNTSAIFNDRCVRRDDNIFSMAKHNNSAITDPGVQIRCSDLQPASNAAYPGTLHRLPVQSLPVSGSTSMAISSYSPQISSSATSGFLQQKLTQPLTALLKQKSEHKNSISQFFIHFKGSEWRGEQLEYQTPAHDVQMLKQQSIEVKFVRNQQRKAQIKPQLFLNKSLNYCFKCKNTLENGSYGVKISIAKIGNNNNGYNTTTDDEDSCASKLNTSDSTQPHLNGSTALYHIQCFTCEECRQVLVDLKAFLYSNSDSKEGSNVKSSLYCSRHFVELYKPRCQSCDHLIFDEECTEAEGKAWHLGHFCCTECKRSLGGQQYIMANPSKQTDKKSIYETKSQIPFQNRDKQLPYCLTCFDILFGELCEECGELIGCDVGAISHEGRSWHARDVCFKCNLCSKALLGKPFLPAFDGRIYCSITCSQEAIQRNRYRDRRKHREVNSSNTDNKTDNDLSKRVQKLQNISQTEEQIPKQMKPKLQMRQNQQIFGQRPEVDNNPKVYANGLPTNVSPINGFNRSPINGLNDEVLNQLPKKFSEFKLNQMPDECEFRTYKQNDGSVLMEDNKNLANITNIDRNLTNDLMNRQMFEYIQKYQQLSKEPNHVMEYVRQQLQSETDGLNGLIGATIEYGSSLSEDERVNQQIVEHMAHTNDMNYNKITPMTSSTSSSLNTNPFELNNILMNPIKYNPSLTHSNSSSNETTPLLLRSLEDRAKQMARIHSQSNQLVNKTKPFSEPSLPKSESPSQTSQADQSSNSSYIENINKTSHSSESHPMSDMKAAEAEADTPSTQSTALHSTSSQTTPETNPRSANKSVTFDPNVKETTGRRVNRKSGSLKSRPTKRSEWSDSHSCSTCSTCSSSSSSSDENFDYDSTLGKSRNQWLGGTKIHYVSNDRKKNSVPESSPNHNHNESCTIS